MCSPTRTPEPRQPKSTNAIVDPVTGQPAMSVAEIREAERLDNQTESVVAGPVLAP